MEEFQRFVRGVERPSRYIGLESNCVRKEPSKVKLRVCLVFPDLYEIGKSHTGFELVYWLFNAHPDVYCERAFLPAPDAISGLRSHNLKLFSLETKTPLDEFDMLGFSLTYELHYTSVLEVLRLSGIPVRNAERGGPPVVIAGGIGCANPEPMADFIDVFAIGDGEVLVPRIVEVMLDAKARSSGKREVLERFANSEFFYVSSLADAGKQELPARRAVLPDLEQAPYPERLVVPLMPIVHDRLTIEIARGCFRGCRFCQAGYFYRPTRERSLPTILEAAQRLVCNTGYDELSLLSLSAGDHSQIEELIDALIKSFSHIPVALSLPSLQLQSLTSNIAQSIARVRKTGFTIAPEAGTERLRRVINKPILDSEIFDTTSAVFKAGWNLIKLYFMIGLPTETDDDIRAIADIVFKLARLRTGGRKPRINVNVATFVPKPHTPFQWAKQLGPREAQRVIDEFKDTFDGRIQLKWHEPEMSFVEGVLSRGGREVGKAIERAWRLGAVLDGWGDHFNASIWRKALDDERIDTEEILAEQSRPKRFPWESVDIGVKREFLESEWESAGATEITPSCKERCADCGVCTGDIKLRLSGADEGTAAPLPPRGCFDMNLRYRVKFTKLGSAALLSHREIYGLLSRALLRAGVYPAYSAGFHPKPKFSFGPPTKVGVESDEEFVDVWLKGFMRTGEFKKRLERELVDGLGVRDVRIVPQDSPSLASSLVGALYRIHTTIDDERIRNAIESFRASGGGEDSMPNFIGGIELREDGAIDIEVCGALMSIPPPDKIVARVFGLNESELREVRIRRVRTYLGTKGEEGVGTSDKRDA